MILDHQKCFSSKGMVIFKSLEGGKNVSTLLRLLYYVKGYAHKQFKFLVGGQRNCVLLRRVGEEGAHYGFHYSRRLSQCLPDEHTLIFGVTGGCSPHPLESRICYGKYVR